LLRILVIAYFAFLCFGVVDNDDLSPVSSIVLVALLSKIYFLAYFEKMGLD